MIVADNGALGHLVQIKRADLLPRLHDRVLVPPAVVWEFAAPETPEPIRAWVASPPSWVEALAPSGEPDRNRPGAGEREAIRLAKEHGALLLCDDLRAVEQGRREGLRVTGMLGILQQTHAHGWLDIEAEIARLRKRTNLRLPEDRLPAIVSAAHELREAQAPD